MLKLAGFWFYNKCQQTLTGKNARVDNSVTFVNEQKWFLKLKYQVKRQSRKSMVSVRGDRVVTGKHKKTNQHKLAIN